MSMLRKFVFWLLVVSLLISMPSLAVAWGKPCPKSCEPYSKIFKCILNIKGSSWKPGVKVCLTENGFKPGVIVSITWDGKKIKEVCANSKGCVSYGFTVPKNSSKGNHTLGVIGSKNKGGTLSLSKSIFVNNKNGKKAKPAKYYSYRSISAISKDVDQASAGSSGSVNLLTISLITGVVLTIMGFGIKLLKG